jgi:UDP-N-acetyl-2-amino-2-deoxyglucuronate dehydrogenase
MSVAFGIIGCGRIAERHLRTLARCREARLVAVSDVSVERMEHLEALWRQTEDSYATLAKSTDYHVLLADPSVQTVIISALSGMHAEMAKTALRAGKHIVLEKPMTLSLRDADEIIELAAAQRRFVQVCHQLRYRPIMKKIKEIIASGALGRIHMGSATLRINRSSHYYSEASWRGTWSQDGGMLLNQGIHVIDLLQWFLGDVRSVYGELSNGNLRKETEDIALGILTFENGAKGIIEVNSVTLPNNLENAISIFAEKGTICIGGTSLNKLERWHMEEAMVSVDEATKLLDDTDEHLYMYRSFIDAVLGKNHSTLIDASEGKRALEIIFAQYKSSIKGTPQTLPITSFSTNMMKHTGSNISNKF